MIGLFDVIGLLASTAVVMVVFGAVFSVFEAPTVLTGWTEL